MCALESPAEADLACCAPKGQTPPATSRRRAGFCTTTTNGLHEMPWSKARSNPRRTNGHRRNKVRAQVLAEETMCWLCGGVVDKSLPPGHPWAPEVDEVIPVSRGGSPYDRSNCRLAHRIHNQQRGNGQRPQRQRQRVPPFTTSRQDTP